MKRALFALVFGCVVSGVAAFSAGAQPTAPRVTLTRLDCGTSKEPRSVAAFSDTHAYDDDAKMSLVASCYLVRHGDELMVWDTGYAVSTRGDPKSPIRLDRTLVEQLRVLGVDPARVSRVGISHYHGDHTGQARDLPGATLLIGAGDWETLTGPGNPNLDRTPLAHWLTGGGNVEPVRGDKDVFGDGSVVMLDTPGHTPGHHSLLVRLKERGDVLLTGDLAHFRRNYDANGVPSFNTDRADTLASLDRFKRMAANLKAVVVIQHEPADVAKLPAFPQSAE